jgi:hypothetical protein
VSVKKENFKMSLRQVILRLSLIFSETCFFVLLYFCLVGSFHGRYLANPTIFLILAGVLTVSNSLVSRQNLRRLTIGLINLLLIVLIVAGMTWRSGPLFFLIPRDALSALNVLLFDLSFLWLGFRAIYLTYQKRLPDPYSHFDWLMILTFLVLLIIGLAKITLPGGVNWIIAAIFFNLLPLLIVNHTGSPVNPLSRGLLVLLIIIVLSGVAQTIPRLSYISGTAGNIFDVLKSSFSTVIAMLGNVLVVMIRLMWGRKTARPAVSDSTSTGPELQPIAGPALPSWVNTVFQLGFLAIIAVLLITVATVIWQLLRGIIVYLLQRQEGQKAPKISLNPFQFWKKAFVLIRKILKKVGYLILLFLPTADISIDRAYLQLLWWGSWKRRPRQIHETPNDYSQRLSGYYPELSVEVQEITTAYIIYQYSGEHPSKISVAALKPLLRKLYLFDWYRLGNFCLKKLNLKRAKINLQ